MKKTILLAVILFFQFVLVAQIQGDVARAGRQLLEEYSFVLEGNWNGKIVYDVAVLNTGEISGLKFNHEESTIKSTPAQMKVRNYIADWKFEAGTHFPKHHQARIIITLVKPK